MPDTPLLDTVKFPADMRGFDIAQLWSFDLPYGSLLSLRVWPGPKTVAQITGLRQ